ncbi:cutinase [Mycena maculata]|uniref:cutinase n=1 Tax=Mycena maculata TaxID=230809 RepID=A0AAD7KDB2_9AGAR|nr:cutinase [Mycena maculata]
MLRAFVTVAILSLLALAAPVIERQAGCTDAIMIFACGTLEPAPIGILVGPPLETALEAALGGKTLTFTGVDYPASIAGFLEGGDPAGSTTMAEDLTNAASSCPDPRRLVGAQLGEAALLQRGRSHQRRRDFCGSGCATSSRQINELITQKGDPDNGQPVQGIPASNVDVFYDVGDDICLGGDLILEPRLTYGLDTPAAAAFIAARV